MSDTGQSRQLAESLNQFASDPVHGLETPPQFIEFLPVAIYACGRDGRILWFNRKAAEMWGRAPRLDQGERFSGFFKAYLEGREIRREQNMMAKVLETGVAIDALEGVIERPNGSRVWVMMHIDPVRDASGNVIGVINCLHDTTEAHKRQQEFEDFFENGAVALHLVSGDGTILRANQAEFDLLGYDREDYVGRNIAEFHADAPVIADILSCLSGGQKLDKYPARLLAKDGSIRHVLITSSAQFRDGQFVNTRCFTIDVTASKLAEEALRERDQRLAATYEHAAIGISEVDAEGRRLRINEAACEILGYSREQMAQSRVFDAPYCDGGTVDLASHRKLVSGALDRYAVEVRFHRADGQMIWLAVKATAVRDGAGRFLYSVRVFYDITEAKHAIEALAANEQRLAATYEHANVGIGEIDASGLLLRVNQTACEITGRPREELLQRNIFDSANSTIHDSDRRQFDALIAGMIERYVVEKRYIRGDGSEIWMEVICSAVRENGKFLFGVRVFQDVTKAKLWAEARVENEQRLAATYEHAAIAISEIDANGRLLRVNEAASTITGYPRDELLGLSVFDLTHPDDRELDRTAYLQQGSANAGSYAAEKRLLRKDGRVIWVSITSSSVRDAAGRFLYGIRVMQDITVRKRADERQKALIDELNHRVKNTLATVQSLAAQTLRGSRVAAETRADFTARLFALSKTHDQLSRTGWESADFKSLVDGVFAPYRTQSGNQVSLDGPSVALRPNAALLLAMVLHELATNAAKYGALSVPSGALDLRWSVATGDAGKRLIITWQESGGPPVKKPTRRGFGSRLAERAILTELRGSADIAFDPAGVSCHFEIPLVTYNP